MADDIYGREIGPDWIEEAAPIQEWMWRSMGRTGAVRTMSGFTAMPASEMVSKFMGQAARIAALEAELAAEKAEHDEVTDQWEAEVARLRTEVESLRVEKRYVEERLALAIRPFDAIASSPAVATGGGRTVIGVDFGSGDSLAMMVGTVRNGRLEFTDLVERPAPKRATHATPFPAKAMR